MTPAEKREIAQKLGQLAKRQPVDPRAGWKRLRDREMAGEQLTEFQAKGWREALGAAPPLPTDADDPDIDYASRERLRSEQERIRQYAAEKGIRL